MSRLIGLLWALAVFASPAALGTAAHAQQSLTTRQMEALSGRSANQAVQADLLSVLEPVREITPGKWVRLRAVRLVTRPFGTEFAGVCRRDAISLQYAPTETESELDEQPLRPYGVQTQPLFRVTKLPKAATGDLADLIWAPGCTSLAGGEALTWFTAADAHQAAEAAHWLRAAVEQVQAGKLHISSCEKSPTTTDSCEAIAVQQGGLSQILSVESCRADPGFRCFAIDIGDLTRLTIVAQSEGDTLDPGEISSVSLAQYIIVT